MSGRIAALTMVRNDDFFLRKWVEYYARELGKENLYIVFDGKDQSVPEFCSGANVEVVEHVEGNVQKADRGRIDLLSERAAALFADYDMVIGSDVDEFLVLDPLCCMGLREFLLKVKTNCPSISALGVDVGQKLGEETALVLDLPFLSQRSYAKLSTRYSKANVLRKPVSWGSGFHRTRKGNFHIIKYLYLFHFGAADLDRIKAKMNDTELQDAGWSTHLKKRSKTIALVNTRRIRDWEKVVGKARIVQNIVRPPYAWNKPAMFEAKIVVKIPERFKNIV